MSMRWVAGILYGVTALASGYWGLRVIFTPGPGGRFFWLPMITFGAPVLLLVGAVLTVFPQLKKRWSVVLAGAIFVVVWAALMRDFSKPYLIFAVVVTLISWAVLGLASALRRPAVVAFIASLTLALIWLPVSIDAIRATLSAIPPFANALALGPLLILWAFIIAASVLSGVASFRRSQA